MGPLTQAEVRANTSNRPRRLVYNAGAGARRGQNGGLRFARWAVVGRSTRVQHISPLFAL